MTCSVLSDGGSWEASRSTYARTASELVECETVMKRRQVLAIR